MADDLVEVRIIRKNYVMCYLTERDNNAFKIGNQAYPISPQFFIRPKNGRGYERIYFIEGNPNPIGAFLPIDVGQDIRYINYVDPQTQEKKILEVPCGATYVDKVLNQSILKQTRGNSLKIGTPKFDWMAFFDKYWIALLCIGVVGIGMAMGFMGV